MEMMGSFLSVGKFRRFFKLNVGEALNFSKCRSLAIVVKSLLLFQASCHQSPSTNSSPSTSLFSTKKIVRFAFFVVFNGIKCCLQTRSLLHILFIVEEFAKMFSKKM
jgi:hypothetical protein